MTANRGHPDVRLLAALDAGLLDEATAREVRAAVDADPAARAVLAALAATRAELAALPDPPVPPALSGRRQQIHRPAGRHPVHHAPAHRITDRAGVR